MWRCQHSMKIVQIINRLVHINEKLYNKSVNLSFFQFVILSFPITLLLSGIIRDPFTGLIVGGIYTLGFVGLVNFYNSRQKETSMLKYAYLLMGFLLVVVSMLWLEILMWLKF